MEIRSCRPLFGVRAVKGVSIVSKTREIEKNLPTVDVTDTIEISSEAEEAFESCENTIVTDTRIS